jgi:hypothetical protein
MHPISVTAWIRGLETHARTRMHSFRLRTYKRRQPDGRESARPRKKTRRAMMGEMAANDRNLFMPSPDEH